MPKFHVILTRDTTESCVISVEADTPEEAEERVFEVYNELTRTTIPDWEVDDAAGRPYLADPGGCAFLPDEEETDDA